MNVAHPLEMLTGAEIKAAINFQVLSFQHLGDDFGQQNRLCKVF